MIKEITDFLDDFRHSTFNELIRDFIHLQSEKQEVNFVLPKHTRNHYLVGKGVNSKYKGAFTKQGIEFIKSIYLQINKFKNPKVLKIIHQKDSNGLITKTDIHLFSGSSEIGTFRIDINKKANATHFFVVQDLLRIFTRLNIKFDLILLDPPYSAKHDKDYGTYKYNKMDNGGIFLKNIVDSCVKILNYEGLIISKNWRSISPPNSTFICGMVTKYGGFRRATVIDVFQYKPKKLFKFSDNTHRETWNNKNPSINRIIGEASAWTEKEKELIYDQINPEHIKKAVMISDSSTNPFKELRFEMETPESFIKSAKTYDLIVLDECRQIGGAVKLTSAIKTKISEQLNPNGIAILKTYFDPALRNKGLSLLEDRVITFRNYEKINFIHIYSKKGNHIKK